MAALLDEVRIATDYILHMPCSPAVSLSRGMHSGGTTLDRDKVTYLDELVSPVGLFRQPLEATLARFERRKKERSIRPYIAEF